MLVENFSVQSPNVKFEEGSITSTYTYHHNEVSGGATRRSLRRT